MLIERIRTSLIIPKIILGTTILLFIFSIAGFYVITNIALGTGNLDGVISESALLSDRIMATVVPGG